MCIFLGQKSMVYGETFLRNYKFYAKTLTKLHDLTVAESFRERHKGTMRFRAIPRLYQSQIPYFIQSIMRGTFIKVLTRLKPTVVNKARSLEETVRRRRPSCDTSVSREKT
jgi:hypothetical protein